MKRIASFILSGLLLAGCATKEQTAPVSTLDVESLRDSVDLNMDITRLSLSDLRILENVFLAQKGYPFEDSYIRSIYQSTTWYDSLMWAFSENEDYYDQNSGYWGGERNEELSYREEYYNSIKPEIIAYTDEQRAFVNRVRQREDELRKRNFKSGNEDDKVNVANIVNPALLKEPDQRLWDYLGHHGFAIVPAQHQQLFHVYEQNDYHEFPAFVTTDLYLQLYHLYFDCMLREVEQEKLMPLLKEFCEEGQKVFARRWQREKENEDAVFNTDGAAEWIVTYFKVANALLEEQAPKGDANALGEYERVMKSVNTTSEFLEYTDVPFEYSLFRPRGHYTRNDNLKRYFRTMMWLQTVPLRSDNPFDMLKANILAVEICDDLDNPRLCSLYKKLTEPMNYLMGMPDDVSIEQVNKIISDIGTCEIDPNELGVKVDEIAEKQTRIRPKFLRTGRNKVRLMPQRYQPDAEVLQEMVDYDSNTTKREVPKGLDVFAAMGVSAAEKILMDELHEPDRWSKYTSNLKRMKKRMNEIKWEDNAATQWMSALKTVIDKPQHAPYFMLSPEWDKKSLNAMLGSWSELKHDAILYAKQPMGAECGGAGPPDPIVKGYVEPNVKFWQKAIDLLKENQKILRTHNLLTEKIATANERLTEEAEFLLAISKKELRGQVLKDVEYDELEYIGAKFENMSLELLRDSEHELWDWEAIQGPDRKVALVADVYTANADNNPNKSILYEAVGDADEIYVVVEIGGYLWLTRGAVFSYREFQRSIDDQRLNDEEWQEYLERHPRSGVPEWMTPVTVPLEKTPVDNESVFYSTGC
ncbi:YARHG domain-containing protein [Prevotella communis]|uniref:YARHG domain-containing protein n=1 Tax=Prevotella communis TaxID=2913614 RepID=A0A1H0I711_9BACT|nr:DUF3160 domain-containing protein [Prevotella communis]SDO27173.1 YARHG domain-containing protein [Prevotella communis]